MIHQFFLHRDATVIPKKKNHGTVVERRNTVSLGIAFHVEYPLTVKF